MSAVINAIEAIGEAVGDVIESVGNAVVDVVDFVADKIVAPVGRAVGKVIEGALNDPIKTIAQVAAIATQQYWALPLIEGADVAIAGGDVGDVLEATAKAYVMQQVGSYVGKAAGAAAGEAAAGAQYGTSGTQAAMLAAQEAGMGTASAIASDIVGAAAGSAAVAVVAGRDPVQALITGGVGAAVPAVLGQVTGFQQLPGSAQRVISAAVTAELSGQNVTAATIGATIAASGVVTGALKSFDPSGSKLDDVQRAIVTDILMGTATAALTNGNPSNVVSAAMMTAGSKALGDMITGAFKTATTETKAAYQKADTKAEEIKANEATQRTAVDNYNSVRNQLQGRIDEQNRLIKVANDTRAALEADNTNEEKYNAAVAAKQAADSYITSLNKDYAEYFRPNLEKYGGELDKLKQNHALLTNDYEAFIKSFATSTDKLTSLLDPLYFTSNRAFVEVMSPGFNAEEYRKLNGLASTEDPYEHFLDKGQFQNAPTNFKAAQAEIVSQRTRLLEEALALKGVNTSTADPAQMGKIIDNLDAKYGNNVAALRTATAQSVLSDNYTMVTRMLDDQQNGVIRIEVSGTAYGAWREPPADKFSLPAGLRYATAEEFNNDSAKLVRTTDGRPVWVIEDPKTAPQNWDAATGSYTTTLAPVVVTGKRPTEVDKLLAYGADPGSWTSVVGKAIVDGAQTLVNWAKDTGNSTLINTAANVIKAGGGFLESINGISVLVGAAPKDTALGKFAEALQGIGKAGNTTEYQAAIKNMQSMIGEAKGVGGTLKAIYGAFKSAPLEFLAEYVGVEGIQEVAPLLIGGVASAGAKGATLALKYGQAVGQRVGTAAGMTAAMTTDIIESAGGSAKNAYDEAYAAARKAGKSEADADKIAIDIAQRSALVAAGTTAVTMGIGGAALEKALIGRTGTGLGDALQAMGDFAKTGSKIAIKEGTTEAGEEAVIQAFLETQLYKLDPTRDVAGNITAAAAFGAIAGGPIAGGAYGASRAGDVISNALLANPMVADTIQTAPNAAAATSALQNLGVTDAGTQANLLNTKYDSQYTSSNEAQTALAKRSDYAYTDADVKALTGATPNSNLDAAVESYVDPRVFDINEAKAAAAAEGYTLTDEQAAALVGQKDEAAATLAARAQYDPQAVTTEEAAKYLADSYKALGFNVTPTAAQVQQFVGQVQEAAQQQAITGYVGENTVTFDEAKKYLSDLGYKPSDAEIRQFVAATNERQQQTAIGAYVDPRLVDEQEARAAYEALGLKKPTQEDVRKLMGQYAETELAGKAQANFDSARYNSIMEQLDGLTVGASQETLDAIAKVKQDLNAQITALGGDVTKLSGDVATAKQSLTEAIAAVERGNTARFGDVDKAIADLKAAGLTTEQVQSIVTQSSTNLSSQFRTALTEAAQGNTTALGELRTNLEAKIGDVQTSLKTALGEQSEAFDAKVQALMAQGRSYQDATTQALSELGVQLSDLGADFTTKLEGLSGSVTRQITDVQTSLTQAIADAKAAGLQGDAALQAAINTVAGDLGTTKADLLAQLGTTESGLRQEFAAQIGGVQTQISGVEAALTQAIADAKAAGLAGDAALQAAINTVAGNLGTTRADLLAQLGTTETALRQEFATQIGGVQTQLGEVQRSILNQMAAYEQAGVARDDALSLAITSVSQQLGTTKADLLAQLGTTEANLKAGLEQQLGLVTADVQAKYNALTAQQKALADQLVQQGADLNTAIQQAQQQTQTQITGLQQDIQTKYATLTADQKALTDRLVAQGVDLNTAIDTVKTQLQGQISGLEATIGRQTTPATQQDLDAIINLLQTQGAYDPTLDYNADRVIDQKDRVAIEQFLRSQQPDYKPDPNQPFRYAPAAGSKWAPTGIFGAMEADRAATEKAFADQAALISDQAARTRAAQNAAALKTQRLGNLNTMMQMVSQSPDVGGQQVSVKAPDPAKIGYIYDWSSIFANPAQEKMFVTPYAQGGQVSSELDDVNDELLKILRG